MSCTRYESLIDRYQSTLLPSQFSVLLFLARRLPPDTASVCVSLPAIIAGTGLSRGTVITSLRALESRGVVVIDRTAETHAYSVPALDGDAVTATPGAAAAAAAGANSAPVQNLNVPSQRLDREKYIYTNKTIKSLNTRARRSKIAPPVATPPMLLPVEPPAPSPPPDDDYLRAQLNAISTTLDLYTCIRKQRPDDLAMRILRAAEAWGANGFVAAAHLNRAHKRISRKREYQPREWAWCVTVVRNEFLAEERAAQEALREDERHVAIDRAKVQSIAEPTLALREAKEQLPPAGTRDANGRFHDPGFYEEIMSQFRTGSR